MTIGEASVGVKKLLKNELYIIHQLASVIWPQSFAHILSKEQIDYMMGIMYSLQALEKDFNAGVEFYVFVYEGMPIGYTAIQQKSNYAWKLHKIYLLQNMHGKGIGKYQLKIMEEIIQGYGATNLYLNVNRNNKAVEFYKSQGYQIVGEEDIDIGEGYFMNDYVMRKSLF